MCDIKNYQELKAYNNKLQELNLPAVAILSVSSSKDTILLDNSLKEQSLYKVLKDYTEAPYFYFENLRKFSKLPFEYYYSLFNPNEAEAQLRDALNACMLIGETDRLVIGNLTLTISNDKWKLMNINNDRATTVYLPEFVEIIGEWAFQNRRNLKKVIVLADEISVFTGAFSGCRELSTFLCKKGVNYVGEFAFRFCYRLEAIRFSENLKVIKDRGFSYCFSLRGLKLPEGLTEIKEFAFSECKELKSVVFPPNLVNIGKYAFYKCKNLMKVDLSKTKVTELKFMAFAESPIKKLIFPEVIRRKNLVMRIDSTAFERYGKMKIYNIPHTIAYIVSVYGTTESEKYYKTDTPDSLENFKRETFMKNVTFES